MFKNIEKEFKSLFRSLNKMNNFNKIILLLFVVLVIYYVFFKRRGVGFSFVNHLNEGFTGSGESITFYKMETCGFCKKFQPKWEKFQQEHPDANVRVVMAGDGDAEIQSNGVQGFPTILLTDSENKKIKEIPRDAFDTAGEVQKVVTGA